MSEDDSIRDDELTSLEDENFSFEFLFSGSVEDEYSVLEDEELFTLEELFTFEDELLTLDELLFFDDEEVFFILEELFSFEDDEEDLLVVVFLDDELFACEDEDFKLEEDSSCEISMKSRCSSISASSTLLLQAPKKPIVKAMQIINRFEKAL